MSDTVQFGSAVRRIRARRERKHRPLWLITSLLLGLAVTVTLAPAAEAAAAYSPPPGAWARFQSDLNAAEGLATGSGVTVALLSTGADPTVPGLAGKVTSGPDYIFTPRIATVRHARHADRGAHRRRARCRPRRRARRAHPGPAHRAGLLRARLLRLLLRPPRTDTQPVNAAASGTRSAVAPG